MNSTDNQTDLEDWLAKRRHWFFRAECPTVILMFVIYGLWAALIWFHAAIPWWLLLPAGAYVTAWHFNFQLEAIHGWRSMPYRLRYAFAWPPLGLWFPFAIYKRNHTIHHRNSKLTYPRVDTETYYHRATDWENYTPLWRSLMMAHQTLLGRLVLGPVLRWRKLVSNDFARFFKGDFADAGIWFRHILGVVVILGYVSFAGMPLWQFLLFFVYGGMTLGLLRPFIEHRWGQKPYERIASVESNWFFGLLFLWNNLHIIHHMYPTMPWYEIPGFYRRNREQVLHVNNHFVYSGYAELVRRYLLVPVFTPVHPDA